MIGVRKLLSQFFLNVNMVYPIVRTQVVLADIVRRRVHDVGATQESMKVEAERFKLEAKKEGGGALTLRR